MNFKLFEMIVFAILVIFLTTCTIFRHQISKDFYKNYNQLKNNEIEGKDFAIETQYVNSEVSIIAPHSGGIEPGTYEITKAIASYKYNYYIFAGIKDKNNQKLHISSDKFDEPLGLALAKKSKYIITIHGCLGESDIIHIGGRDTISKKIISRELDKAGFAVTHAESGYFSGKNPMNICNKSYRQKGVQLEISYSLRENMFRDLSFEGRKKTTEVFQRFVKAVRKAASEMN